MLKDRLRTSAILISIVACLLYLDGHYPLAGAEGLWLLPLLLFFALGTASDMSFLLSNSGRVISRRATTLATTMVTVSACVPMLWPLFGSIYPATCPVGELGWIMLAGIGAIFVVLLDEMSRYGKRDGKPENPGSGTIERTCAAVFVSLYVGLPMALLVALRSLGEGNWGLAALLVTIAVTKSTDAGAYFSGKALGKHKLIPRLSPGKTVEGAIGGVLTATIVAFVCLKWLFPQIAGSSIGPVATPSIPGIDQSIWGALLLGPLLAVSGMVGD
jgi:phosphatidate cytidylyltransferase